MAFTYMWMDTYLDAITTTLNKNKNEFSLKNKPSSKSKFLCPFHDGFHIFSFSSHMI